MDLIKLRKLLRKWLSKITSVIKLGLQNIMILFSMNEWINHVVYIMSENSEKCKMQVPRAPGAHSDILKLLFPLTSSDKLKIFNFNHIKLRKTANLHIWETETSEFLSILPGKKTTKVQRCPMWIQCCYWCKCSFVIWAT